MFRRIVLPLSLPAVAVTALFSFLAAWNEFLLALVSNTSNEQYTLPVGLASMIPANGRFVAGDLAFALPGHLIVDDGPCTFGIRPEEVAIAETGGIPADVVGIERLGGESVYHLTVAGHSIKALWRREDISTPNVRLAVDSAVVFGGTATDGSVISNTGNPV